MSIRLLIAEVDPATMNVTEFCRSHGISTWLFWQLRSRFAAGGVEALAPGSRAPHTVANKTPLAIEETLVRARKDLAGRGLDAGAASIRFELRDLPGLPSEATIWRILKQRGQVIAEPAKAPKHTGRRFAAERANESWQLDDTDHDLADDTAVKILNVIDDHSRLAVACRGLPACTGTAALDTISQAATTLGWPQRIQSDNAPAFRYVLADALSELGVGARHSRPYNPRCNGKVERFHQTQQRWLTAQAHQASTIDELQQQLDLFRHIYNHQRPHRGIDRQFPGDVWSAAPKSGPADRPLTTPTSIHHDIVNSGTVCAGRYKIALGKRHNGQRALIVTTGTSCHVFLDGQLARRLTLDPTRRLQPRRTTTVSKDPRHA